MLRTPIRSSIPLLLALPLMLLCAPLVAAETRPVVSDLDAALGALERLAYDDAAGILKRLAQAGDARAQTALATLMESGLTSADYPATPLELLHAAAAQNIPEAALELGNRYYLGDGVARDPAESLAWWQRAAEYGSARAAYNLGVTALDAERPDSHAARAWLQQAADGDIAAAWFALGVLNLRGPEGSAAYDAACASFSRAAERGNARAAANLGAMYERGIACPRNAATAIDWYRRAAANGIPGAQAHVTRLQSTTVVPSVHDDAWVLGQDPAHYTVQIANGTNEQAIMQILAHHDRDIARARLRLNTAEPPRFVAIVGVFANYFDALNYLNALPATLTGTKPWIRRFGSLQELTGPR